MRDSLRTPREEPPRFILKPLRVLRRLFMMTVMVLLLVEEIYFVMLIQMVTKQPNGMVQIQPSLAPAQPLHRPDFGMLPLAIELRIMTRQMIGKMKVWV